MAQPSPKAKRTPLRPRGNVVLMRPQPTLKPPPPHLDTPEAALWRSITSDYAIDDDAALEILTTVLEAHARCRRCRTQIDKDGEVLVDRFGQLRAHPLLVAERGARDSYLVALRLLNLDVASIAR